MGFIFQKLKFIASRFRAYIVLSIEVFFLKKKDNKKYLSDIKVRKTYFSEHDLIMQTFLHLNYNRKTLYLVLINCKTRILQFYLLKFQKIYSLVLSTSKYTKLIIEKYRNQQIFTFRRSYVFSYMYITLCLNTFSLCMHRLIA